MTNPFSLFTRYVFFFLEIIGSINLIDTFCLQTTMEGVTAHVSSFFYFLSACVFRKNWRICLSVFVLKSICFAVPVLKEKQSSVLEVGSPHDISASLTTRFYA